MEEPQLYDAEVRMIKALNTLQPFGYNMTPGGEFSPTRDPEIAARMCATRRKNGLNDHSPLTKAKIASSVKESWKYRDRTVTEAQREKISCAMKASWKRGERVGHTQTAETRQKISRNTASRRPEMRALGSARMRGESNIAKRPEVRAKISIALRGNTNGVGAVHIVSDETKRKFADASRRNNPMRNPATVARKLATMKRNREAQLVIG
jgi:hypothetical protein